jgi:hypothetical protein
LSTIISKESVSKCILFSFFVVVWCAITVSMTVHCGLYRMHCILACCLLFHFLYP